MDNIGTPHEQGKPDEVLQDPVASADEQTGELPQAVPQESVTNVATIETPSATLQMEQNGSMEAEISPKPTEPTVSIPPFDTVATQVSPQASPTLFGASPSPAIAQAEPTRGVIGMLLAKANTVLRSRRKKKLERIMALAVAKKTIVNDDVQKSLRVSHVSSARYLAELVKAGKLQMVGSIHQPRYKIPE